MGTHWSLNLKGSGPNSLQHKIQSYNWEESQSVHKKKSTLLANVMQLCRPLPSHTCSILLGSKLQSCEVDKIWGRSWKPFGNLFWLCQALPSTPGTREWFANIPMIALIIALFCIANMANLHTSHEICNFLIRLLKFISKDNFAFYLEVADESRF